MTVIQMRRGTSTQWSTANPVLASGEIGYDETVKNIKIGDGTTTWNTLRFESTDRSYRQYLPAQGPVDYDDGITTFLASSADGWSFWPSSTFADIMTIKPRGFAVATQMAFPYSDDTLAPMWRSWENSGSAWTAWQVTASVDYVDDRTNKYTPKAYGAVADGVTDDKTAINAAIQAAKTANAELYWPPGDYYTSGSLTDFWTIHHVGPGRIKAGSDTYYITPGSADTNIVYVTASTGNDGNDGLSSSRALATIPKIDTVIQKVGKAIQTGYWKFRLSGSFAGGYTFARNLRPANAITFEGDPLVSNLPVTTIDYVSGGSIFGLRFEPGAWVKLVNLKFTDFVVGFNGYGALIKGGGDMYVLDCWADNCDTGFGCVDQAVMGVHSSDVTNCDTGIRVQYGSTGTIGALGLPTTIDNCTVGVLVSRNAVIHFDYSTVTDCTFAGINVDMQSRMAMIDGTVHRNAVGVLIQGAAEWTQDEDTDWGIGTANENTVNWRHKGAGHENRLHSQDTNVEWRMYCSTQSYSTSAGVNTALVSFGSVYKFQPRQFSERNVQKIRVKMHGVLTGTGSKSLQFYKTKTDGTSQVALGGVSGVTQAGNFELEIEIWPTANNAQMYAARLSIHGQTVSLVRGTAAADNIDAWLFRVYANSGVATTSTVQVDMIEMFISG